MKSFKSVCFPFSNIPDIFILVFCAYFNLDCLQPSIFFVFFLRSLIERGERAASELDANEGVVGGGGGGGSEKKIDSRFPLALLADSLVFFFFGVKK